MARLANLSISRLHALFREEMDTSPHVWLQQQRIARACDLLATSDASIVEIALAAGFSEQSALTRAMRDSIDATPAAYSMGSSTSAPSLFSALAVADHSTL